eukprot:gene20868-21589_t
MRGALPPAWTKSLAISSDGRKRAVHIVHHNLSARWWRPMSPRPDRSGLFLSLFARVHRASVNGGWQLLTRRDWPETRFGVYNAWLSALIRIGCQNIIQEVALFKNGLLCLALTTSLCAAPAWAGGNPSNQADPLTDLYGRLFGSQPDGQSGAFTVAHDGAKTRVTIDVAALAKPLNAMGLSVVSKPLTYVFTPQDDGTIRQDSEGQQDLALAIDIAAPEQQTGLFKYEGMSFSALIDPKVAFVRTLAAKVAHATGEIRQPGIGMSVAIDGSGNELTVNSTNAADGSVDVRGAQVMAGAVETIRIDPANASKPPVAPAMNAEIKVLSGRSDFSIDGLKTLAVRDMLTFLLAQKQVSQMSESEALSAQEKLKEHVRDVAPLLRTASVTARVDGISVQSPYGSGSIGTFQVGLDANTGDVQHLAGVSYKIDDFKIDSAFLPVWSKPLVPTNLDLAFGVGDIDVNGGLTKVVDNLDVTKHDLVAEEVLPEVKAAFLPRGTVHLELKPSSIKGTTYAVNWQGGMDVEDNHAKTHLDVSMTGLDSIIATLSKVKDKGVPETLVGLYGAQALAKPGPNGSLTWAIDYEDGGVLLVNGAPVGGKKI